MRSCAACWSTRTRPLGVFHEDVELAEHAEDFEIAGSALRSSRLKVRCSMFDVRRSMFSPAAAALAQDSRSARWTLDVGRWALERSAPRSGAGCKGSARPVFAAARPARGRWDEREPFLLSARTVKTGDDGSARRGLEGSATSSARSLSSVHAHRLRRRLRGPTRRCGKRTSRFAGCTFTSTSAGIHLDEEKRDRMLPFHQRGVVALAQGEIDGAVFHGAPVEEDELLRAGRAAHACAFRCSPRMLMPSASSRELRHVEHFRGERRAAEVADSRSRK